MGTCLQPVKAISRGVTRRAANQRAELGAKGGWGDPLAGTGVERRPRTQEETQRLSHPVSLGVSLEPGGDREADLGGLGPSPADRGRTLPREPGWSQDAEGATAHLASPRACRCHTRWLRLALGDLATGCLATWLLNADPITHTHAQSHMHTCAHACIHTCTNTRAYTHTCVNQLHTQICTCTVWAPRCVCVCTHIHCNSTIPGRLIPSRSFPTRSPSLIFSPNPCPTCLTPGSHLQEVLPDSLHANCSLLRPRDIIFLPKSLATSF